jgi:hypothetical protein
MLAVAVASCAGRLPADQHAASKSPRKTGRTCAPGVLCMRDIERRDPKVGALEVIDTPDTVAR